MGHMPCFCIWNMEKERIKEIIEPIVNDHGCDFWGLEISQGKNIPTLRVFIAAINGATIDDCENISRDLILELSVDSDFIDDYVKTTEMSKNDKLKDLELMIEHFVQEERYEDCALLVEIKNKIKKFYETSKTKRQL